MCGNGSRVDHNNELTNRPADNNNYSTIIFQNWLTVTERGDDTQARVTLTRTRDTDTHAQLQRASIICTEYWTHPSYVQHENVWVGWFSVIMTDSICEAV